MSTLSTTRRRWMSAARNALLDLGRTPSRAICDPEAEADRLASYPNPYPSGWYVVARSDEVTRKPRHVRVVGRSLVVYRGESGRVAVLDSVCPHQGANLADGTVRGDCIECPFHKWQLDARGQVTAIPYNDRLTASLRTTAYHVDERYGFVSFYHEHEQHDRAGMSPEPPYWPMRFDAIDGGDQVYHGDHDAGIVTMHLIEFAENSVDFQHFSPLHGEMFLPWTGIKVPGVEVVHQARWELDAERPHVAWFLNDAVLKIGGREFPRTGASARICIDGPGGLVSFHFDIPSVGRITLFHMHSPEGPLSQRVRFRWYADRKMPRALAAYVVGNWLSQWKEDVRVWEGKTYRVRPMLVKGDGPVHPMRRWYTRFYGPPAAELTRNAASHA